MTKRRKGGKRNEVMLLLEQSPQWLLSVWLVKGFFKKKATNICLSQSWRDRNSIDRQNDMQKGKKAQDVRNLKLKVIVEW